MSENRVYNQLPKHFQTKANKRLLGLTADPLWEPANVEQFQGMIGDTANISETTRAKTPPLASRDNTTDLLSTTVIVHDEAGNPITGAFFGDLFGHLKAAGTPDEIENVFECPFFSFTPPIDFDRWTNFQKYVWTGEGSAVDLAEYILKDPVGTKIVLHVVTDEGFQETPVIVGTGSIGSGFPSSPTGTYREASFVEGRPIYRFDGSDWLPVQFIAVDELPSNSAEYDIGTALYVCRYGYEYQRIVLRHWSAGAGRFLTKTPIISRLEPAKPAVGAVWDRVTDSVRTFLEWDGSDWRPADYWCTDALEGFEPQEDDDLRYMYQVVDYASVTDPWAKNNWWVHWSDLTRVDQLARVSDQAVRPILQFWSGIEAFDIVKTRRNQQPSFNVYKFDGTNILSMTGNAEGFVGNHILAFKRGTGTDDKILGLPLSWDETGEILFDLELESKTYRSLASSVAYKGYSFFKDADTGKYHSVWKRSSQTLPLVDGTPANWSSNPTHDTETLLSRRNLLTHMTSVIDQNAAGSPRGDNDWRWSKQDPTIGATIIDAEGSLLRLGVLMTDNKYDPVSAMRRISQEYGRFFRRFNRVMNDVFSDPAITTPDFRWIGGDFDEAVNVILRELVVYMDPTKPLAAGMGQYEDVDGVDKNIPLPASPARVGLAPAYEPRIVIYPDGKYVLGHDGSLTPAYGDDRDNILLALEQRFFDAIPEKRRTETEDRSSRKDGDVISVFDYASGFEIGQVATFGLIENDVEQLVSPSNGQTAFDLKTGSYAERSNGAWVRRRAQKGEVFNHGGGANFYIWNGFSLEALPLFGKQVGEYSIQQYRAAVRREFEQWVFSEQVDPGSRDDFNSSDEWTWNYSASGTEGSWSGLYKRIYGTDRPHEAPWEILGYSIRPDWWDDTHGAPDSEEDGNDRWTSAHDCWTAIAEAEGWADTDTPTPVDEDGFLKDPVALGIVNMSLVGGGGELWRYGDDGPQERRWRRSREGRFAEAIGLYLLKPARTVEPFWSDYSFTLPEPSSFANGRMLVDDERFLRPVAYGDLHGVNDVIDPGFGSWVATAIELNGGSAQTLSGDLSRAKTSLAWKCQGYIVDDSLSVMLPSGKQIPEENISLFIHRSKPISTHVMSGLQIVKRGSSYEVWGYDETNPSFTVLPGLKPNSGGRIQREEEIDGETGQQEFRLTNIRIGQADLSTVLVTINDNVLTPNLFSFPTQNTLRLSGTLRQNATIKIKTTTAYSAPGARAQRLTVNGVTYFYYSDADDTTQQIAYGTLLDGIQSVVEFIYDYGRYLTHNGWTFNDEEWLDVAARFVTWALDANDNQIFVDVASGKSVTFTTEFGQVGNMNDTDGSSVFDIAGLPLRSANYFRDDGSITITSAGDHVFLARVPVVAIQHVVMFPQTTRFEDIIFEPFSGIRQRRMIVRGYRTKDWVGRFDTPGFITDGNGNLVQNLDTRAKEVTKWLDTIQGPMSKKAAEQAWSLYGWQPDDAASAIGASKEMSFDRHRNVIRQKGTLPAIESFSTMKSGSDLISVRECWAWKTGEFGNGIRELLGSVSIQPQDITSRRMAINFGAIDDETVISIPDFPSDVWVRRPKKANLKLTTNMNVGLIRSDRLLARPFQWDPSAGLHEPLAISTIDYEQPTDPAYYTEGEDRVNVGLSWGAAEEGTLWWDTSTRSYMNYTAMSPVDAVSNWGRLSYQSVSSSAYNSSIRLIMSSTSGFTAGNVYMAVDREGYQYPFHVEAVSSGTVLLGDFLMSSTKKPTADSVIEIIRGSVDVWVWTKSDVPPTLSNVTDYTGPRVRSNDAPYSVYTDKNGKSTYWYWQTNLDTIVGKKPMSTNLTAERLREPSGEGLPWFGIKNNTMMVLDFAETDVRSEFQIQLQNLNNSAAVHDHWEVLVESDESTVDQRVIKLLLASIAGKDELGRPVPSLERAAIDRIGIGRGQSVFPDVDAARAVFKSSINRLMMTTDNRTSDSFSKAFSEERVNDYWERADYGSSNPWPVETVGTREQLEAIHDPMKTDVVTVLRAFKIDGVWKREAYEFDGTQWLTIRSESTTAKVNDNAFIDYSTTRRATLALNTAAYNEFAFDLLKEMLRQNPGCRWFMKTTLVDLVAPVLTDQSQDVGPDEVAMVEQAFNEVKPYSTKIRRLISRNKIINNETEFEDVTVEVTETNQKNLGLFFDRLSCNMFDDDTWDTESIDFRAYDFQPWDMDDLGANYWTTFDEFTSVAGQRIYPFGLANAAAKYRVVAVTNQGTATAPAHAIDMTGGYLTVRFWVTPPANRTFRIEQVAAVVSPQLIPLSRYGSGRALSTWEHASAVTRSRLSGIANSREVTDDECSLYDGCSPCDALDGGMPGERVKPITTEGVAITVTTYWTEALGGWDAAPMDMLPYDSTLAGGAPIVTTTFIGRADVTNATSETIPMTEEVEVDFDGHVWSTDSRAKIGWIKDGSEDITEECTRISNTAFRTNAAPGSTLTLVRSEYELRSKSFQISTHPTATYEIADTHRLVMKAMPADGSEFVVDYQDAPISPAAPTAHLRDVDGVVISLVLTDFDDLDWTNPPASAMVLITTTGKLYTYDGNEWDESDADVTKRYWSLADDKTYIYSGSAWVLSSNPEDEGSEYDRFGFGWAGVTAGMGAIDDDNFDVARLLTRHDPNLDSALLWIGPHTPRILNQNRRILWWYTVDGRMLITGGDTMQPAEDYDTVGQGGPRGQIGRVMMHDADEDLADLWSDGHAIFVVSPTGVGENNNGIIYTTEDGTSGWSFRTVPALTPQADYAFVFRLWRAGGLASWHIETSELTFDVRQVFQIDIGNNGADEPVFTMNGDVVNAIALTTASGDFEPSDGSGFLVNNEAVDSAFVGTLNEIFLQTGDISDAAANHFAYLYGGDLTDDQNLLVSSIYMTADAAATVVNNPVVDRDGNLVLDRNNSVIGGR